MKMSSYIYVLATIFVNIMIKKVIQDIEHYFLQVLSLNSELKRIGSTMGNVILEMNEDGSVKVDDNNHVIVKGTIPAALLFRGQSSNYPLIPKLGRDRKDVIYERIEKSLIQEIKRRGDKIMSSSGLNDWELLVYVQHYGLATRLLDWTTNPLTALWFACQNAKKNSSAYVYMLRYDDGDLLDITTEKSPFEISKTKVYKPNMNNERIIAQNGWFTIHSLQNDKRKFIPVEEDEDFKDYIMEIEIPSKKQEEILGKLNILGVNHETIFPGVEGACRHVNWLNQL